MNGSHLNDTQMPPRRDIMTLQQFKTRGLALIGAGLFALALLVVSGMGSAAPTARADGPVRATPSGAIAARLPAPAPARPFGQLLGPSCPEGTILIMWDMPVYDSDGLFVVGHVSVPFCIPEDLEPAG
jgi:hypothetical protein